MNSDKFQAAFKGVPLQDVMTITAYLQKHLQDKIARDGGTREEIAAVNLARKELADCRRRGLGK